MYGLLKNISPLHDITLISFCDRRELELARDLKSLPLQFHAIPRGKGAGKNIGWNVYLASTRLLQFFRSVALWQPYYVAKFYHPRMARLIRQLTSDTAFDIVQLEMVQMAQYVEFSGRGRKVLQAHDVAFRPAYRRYRSAASVLGKAISFVEWCRWSLFERKMAVRFDRVITVTEQDKMLLERLTGSRCVSYLPRGADIADTLPQYSEREKETILFVGTFSHRPNREAGLWLAGEIFPLVQRTFPGSVLLVIGSNPPAPLRDLAARNDHIRILGFVDDVAVHLRSAAVFAAPLRSGGGVKVKILHAMGQGIPVVTTKVGAEGIEGLTSASVLVGDTAEKLADSICALFKDRERAAGIGMNGWKVMKEHYSWKSVTRRLEEIYSATLSQ